MGDCVFCKIANGEIPAATLYEDEDFRVILDLGPASKGHSLILPKKHAANIYELPDETAGKAMILAKKMAGKLSDALNCDGFNIVQNNGEIAGQTVFHFHMHLIPRYKGDGVGLTWTPGELNDAYGVLHDWNISDDVSQDVLYKMYTKRKHLNIDNEKMMYSLIRRASVNKAMDYKKKSSFRHEVICTADVTEVLNVYKTVDAEEELLRKEKNKFMYMVLERFREEQPVNYDILIQVKYLDVPVEVVAEEYGLTKSGVNNRIYKAKRWLKEEFRKVYE